MVNKSSANYQNKLSGFTIVELLIVVVVIGILATITIISYNGITQRAAGASLQSDLSGASTQLKMYQIENGSYPTTNDCNGGPQPLPPAICLQSSSGNSFFSYSADNSGPSPTFILIAKNGSNKYGITNDSSPYVIVPIVASGGIMTTFEQYTIHTFNSSGTLTVTGGTIAGAEVLIVGGGGGSGGTYESGSGGAGQFLTTVSNLTGSMPVVIGNGGAIRVNGASSSLGGLIAIGGGAGGFNSVGANGGSGGGGGTNGSTLYAGGTGLAGYDGGSAGTGGFACTSGLPGGGGGAGSVGGAGRSCMAGGRGIGLSSDISGATRWYAGGGSSEYNNNSQDGGGGVSTPNGTPNTGGGGGGSTGIGGSGVVIIRYLTD